MVDSTTFMPHTQRFKKHVDECVKSKNMTPEEAQSLFIDWDILMKRLKNCTSKDAEHWMNIVANLEWEVEGRESPSQAAQESFDLMIKAYTEHFRQRSTSISACSLLQCLQACLLATVMFASGWLRALLLLCVWSTA